MIRNTELIASGRDQPLKDPRKRAVEQGHVMNKLIQPVSAVAFAATIAGAITILPTLSEPVDASAPFVVAIAAAPVP